MPRPGLRSRSKKRIHKTLPGGRKTIHYKGKVKSLPSCFCCNKIISGISSKEPYKLNRSKTTISRPYGRLLCSKCLKNLLKNAIRSL